MNTGWNSLVDAETLAAALDSDDLVIIDCRFSLVASPGPRNAGELAYLAAHLPGARHAHLARDLSGPFAGAAADAGRHPWPDAAAFRATLARWGIDARTQVVAYDDGDGAFAARLWFLLQALGHRSVAVLDGGWARWTTLGLPVDDQPSPTIPVAEETVPEMDFDAGRLLDADDVQRHLDGGGLLIDARAAERFRGEVEPIDRVAGHVPGAVNRPYADNLVNGHFKSSAQLAQEFDALLHGRQPEVVVAMCGSGVTACHHLLAMAHAGRPGARLFTGSWSGWIADASRPVAGA